MKKIILFTLFIFLFSACGTPKYGCKGKSESWGKMVKRINKS